MNSIGGGSRLGPLFRPLLAQRTEGGSSLGPVVSTSLRGCKVHAGGVLPLFLIDVFGAGVRSAVGSDLTWRRAYKPGRVAPHCLPDSGGADCSCRQAASTPLLGCGSAREALRHRRVLRCTHRSAVHNPRAASPRRSLLRGGGRGMLRCTHPRGGGGVSAGMTAGCSAALTQRPGGLAKSRGRVGPGGAAGIRWSGGGCPRCPSRPFCEHFSRFSSISIASPTRHAQRLSVQALMGPCAVGSHAGGVPGRWIQERPSSPQESSLRAHFETSEHAAGGGAIQVCMALMAQLVQTR